MGSIFDDFLAMLGYRERRFRYGCPGGSGKQEPASGFA